MVSFLKVKNVFLLSVVSVLPQNDLVVEVSLFSFECNEDSHMDTLCGVDSECGVSLPFKNRYLFLCSL